MKNEPNEVKLIIEILLLLTLERRKWYKKFLKTSSGLKKEGLKHRFSHNLQTTIHHR